MKNKILKLTLVTLTLAFGALPMYALAAGDFTIYPTYAHEGNKSWIITSAMQGDTVTEYVNLENLSGETQKISLNFKEASAQKDNFVIFENPDFRTMGNWISFNKEAYILAPGEKIKIPVEIQIPKNVKADKYYGAIFAVKEATDTNNKNIEIVTRIGVRIYLDVTPEINGFASVLQSGGNQSLFFLWLSAFGLLASIIYNLILHGEHKAYAKKQ
jgi:uncharacterized membrane protein